jgi:hypothetical protein
MTPSMEQLRPLTLGEIIDRAVSFWRQRWRPLFVIYLGWALAGYAVFKASGLIVERYFPEVKALTGSLAELKVMRQADPIVLLKGAGVLSAGLLLYVLIGSLGSVSVTRYAMLEYLGMKVAPRDAIREGARRSGSAVGLFLMSMVWTGLVTLLSMVPGGALMALSVRNDSVLGATLGGLLMLGGLLVAVLWSILRFFLSSQLVAMEDVSLWRLFVRSGQLTSGRVGPGVIGFVKLRLTVLLTVMGLVLMLVSMIGSTPTFILQAAFYPAPIPWFVGVPAELVDTVFTALISPVYVVFQTVVYLDMRVRREGLDLKLKLSSAEEALKAA